MFFEEYFKNRGESIEPNTQNEVQVRCPFPHDNGHIEKNASASFNINEESINVLHVLLKTENWECQKQPSFPKYLKQLMTMPLN
jgi:hypothetical protein